MIRVLAFAALALLLCGVRHAQAQPALWVSAGGHSLHAEPGFNGHNPGLLLEAQLNERHSLIAGFLRNSQSRRSHMLAGTYTPAQLKLTADVVLRAGVIAGVVDGYRLRDGRPTPFAGLQAELGTDRVRFAATLLPPVPGTSAGAIFLTVKVRLP